MVPQLKGSYTTDWDSTLATSFGGWTEDTNHQPTGYFHTFHVGGLGFQVLGQTNEGHVAELPRLAVPSPVRPFLIDAWPIGSAASWPPEGIVMELEHLRILAGWPGRLIGMGRDHPRHQSHEAQ
jgi:hypothetical protein